MSVSRLVRAFEGVGRVPVDLEEVVSKVRSFVPDERVTVLGVDIDPSKLRGLCLTVKEDDGSQVMMRIKHSRVLFSTRMPLCEQRLVCCKELMHVLDPDPIRTSSHNEILPLAERMAHGHTFSLQGPDDVKAFMDAIAKWQALALLFPFGFYEEIYPKYKAGLIKLQQVADDLQIPASYAHVVLSDEWEWMRTTFLAHA